MAEVLLVPDKAPAAAVASLDEHLLQAYKSWAALEEAERRRRLETVLVALYSLVLTQHDSTWATYIASERTVESARRVEREVAGLREATEAERALGTEETIGERLAMLPAHHREVALRRWQEAREDTWRVLISVTSSKSRPRHNLDLQRAGCGRGLARQLFHSAIAVD